MPLTPSEAMEMRALTEELDRIAGTPAPLDDAQLADCGALLALVDRRDNAGNLATNIRLARTAILASVARIPVARDRAIAQAMFATRSRDVGLQVQTRKLHLASGKDRVSATTFDKHRKRVLSDVSLYLLVDSQDRAALTNRPTRAHDGYAMEAMRLSSATHYLWLAARFCARRDRFEPHAPVTYSVRDETGCSDQLLFTCIWLFDLLKAGDELIQELQTSGGVNDVPHLLEKVRGLSPFDGDELTDQVEDWTLGLIDHQELRANFLAAWRPFAGADRPYLVEDPASQVSTLGRLCGHLAHALGRSLGHTAPPISIGRHMAYIATARFFGTDLSMTFPNGRSARSYLDAFLDLATAESLNAGIDS